MSPSSASLVGTPERSLLSEARAQVGTRARRGARVPEPERLREVLGEELGLVGPGPGRPGGRSIARVEEARGDEARGDEAPSDEGAADPRLRASRRGPTLGQVLADAEARGELGALGLREPQRRALFRSTRCRTPALGGAAEVCAGCDYRQVVFRSCGDRHCPQCLLLAGERWLRAELARSLPVAYYHLVLTLPPGLRPIAERGPAEARVVYGALFRAVRRAIEACGRAELGEASARFSITEVLHTWNASFAYHPHVHAIVSAGALGEGGWLEPRPGRSLFPDDVLRAAYRVAFADELVRLAQLAERGRRGGLELRAGELARLLAGIGRDYQHVYAKALLDPEQAFRYLARYTARVGFSDHRLIAYDPAGRGQVVFGTKHGEAVRCSRSELAARFACHVLPRGFHRVRRYGLFAPCKQRVSLAAARAALRAAYPARAADCEAPEVLRPDGSFVRRFFRERGVDLDRCPRPGCGGILVSRPLDPVYLDASELHEGQRGPPRAPT